MGARADAESLTVGHAVVAREEEEDPRDHLGDEGQDDAAGVQGDVAAASRGSARRPDPLHRF